MSRQRDVTELDLAELSDFENSTTFSEAEKLALRYAEAMTHTPADVPQDLFDAMSRHFDPKQLVELTSAIAWENYRSRFNRPFDVQSGGYSEGAVCAVPDRAASATAGRG